MALHCFVLCRFVLLLSIVYQSHFQHFGYSYNKTFIDIRLCPGAATLLVVVRRPTTAKRDVIYKPELHNVLQRR